MLNLLINKLPSEAPHLKKKKTCLDNTKITIVTEGRHVRTVLFTLNGYAMARDTREADWHDYSQRLLHVALLISPVVSAADDDVLIGHRRSDSNRMLSHT